MELLTVVLTILADGGFVLRCPETVGNTEIYLEGAEAVGFLGKEATFLGTKEGEKERETNWRWEEKKGKEVPLL